MTTMLDGATSVRVMSLKTRVSFSLLGRDNNGHKDGEGRIVPVTHGNEKERRAYRGSRTEMRAVA